MMKIVPLIPAHNFAEKRPPTCKELDDARVKANKYLAQLRRASNVRLTRDAFQGVNKGIKTFYDAQLVDNLARQIPPSSFVQRNRAFAQKS